MVSDPTKDIMKILITGHKGFIGSNMMTAFRKLGHVVDGVDLKDFESIKDMFSTIIESISSYDHVIHLGAISSTTEMNVEKIMDTNYRFSADLCILCESHNIPMQYASSASVYGAGSLYFTEGSPKIPLTPYAWTKYLFDAEIAPRTNNIIQGFRYFNVYGPGEEHKGSQASPFTQFKQQYDRGENVKVFAGSELIYRDFIHVNEVIDIHRRFLGAPVSGIWNVGSGTPRSFYSIAREISPDRPIQIIDFPEHLKQRYQYYTCADLTKLRATLHDYSL